MDRVNSEKHDLSPYNELIHDDVIHECQSCHQSFLAKYWDDELDWYIELNSTVFCRYCQDSPV